MPTSQRISGNSDTRWN